jgi:type I restriction enzyme, S subunit
MSWEEVEIGKCCSIVSGSTPSRNTTEFWAGDIHWFTPKDLSDIVGKYVDEAPERITKEGYNSCSTNIIPPNSLLFTSRAPIGHIAINLREACTNQGFKSLVPKDGVDVNYLYYLIKKITPLLQDLGNGATFKELSKATLEKVKIPLPPLEDQKRIAAILDAADALRQKDRALIAKYEELTQSLFMDMFGDPVTNPKGWIISALGKVCAKVTDGTHHSPPLIGAGYPYVTAKHVKTYGLDFQRDPTFVEEKYHKYIFKRCNPGYGDVLYIKDGATTGIACINTFKEEISLLSSLALLKPDYGRINNYYLAYWLNNNRVKNKLISEYMSGAAIKRYTLKKINSFILPVPPINLQNKFAESVQQIEKQKQLAQQSLQKSEELFNSLLQRAFKGELTDTKSSPPLTRSNAELVSASVTD